MATRKLFVGEMRDELARRRINEMLGRVEKLTSMVGDGETDSDVVWEEIVALQNAMATASANLSTAQSNISSLTTSVAGKNPTITPASAIADASTGLTITLLTQVALSINNTNAKINQILAALRSTHIINT